MPKVAEVVILLRRRQHPVSVRVAAELHRLLNQAAGNHVRGHRRHQRVRGHRCPLPRFVRQRRRLQRSPKMVFVRGQVAVRRVLQSLLHVREVRCLPIGLLLQLLSPVDPALHTFRHLGLRGRCMWLRLRVPGVLSTPRHGFVLFPLPPGVRHAAIRLFPTFLE